MNNIITEEIKHNQTWDEWLMRGVYWAASKSKDKKTHIGALIVKDNRILSTGFNGLPAKVRDLDERLERPLKYLYVSHAERNAIYTAAKHGISTDGCVLYTNALPCSDCVKGIIQSGISEIVVHTQFNDYCKIISRPEWEKHAEISNVMLNESGVYVRSFDMILGINSYIDGKQIEI